MGSHTFRDKYHYPALPTEGWTRLLVLNPGLGPLSCSLRPARLEDSILSYEAISYVWGDDASQGSTEIACNGQMLLVSANLACALTYMRYTKDERTLWADALCINQEDTQERSQQVQQMGGIYEGARRVLVWIGEDPYGEAEECFDMIKQTNNVLVNLLSIHESVEKIPYMSPSSGSMTTLPREWGTVRRLMDAPWFTRVWTLQEVGLARSAVILYGKSSLNWNILVELMLWVAARPDIGMHISNVKSGMIWDVFEGIWCSFANANSWRNELRCTAFLAQSRPEQTLLDILNVTRPYQATDPRDRIYAFLNHPHATSLASDGAKFVFADYSKSVEDVYVDVASYIVRSTQYPWMVLSSVDHTRDAPALCGQRPSWVPWWNEDWRVYWLGYSTMWYRAGGLQASAFQAAISSHHELHVRAILFDTVEWVSAPFMSDSLRSEQRARRNPMGRLWETLARSGGQSRYGISRDSEIAFSLVVAAGRAADEGPAEDDLTLHRSIYDSSQSPLYCSDHHARKPLPTDHDESLGLAVDTYASNQLRALHNRKLFRTRSGYYGICHFAVTKDDTCCVIRGANVPFVLRGVADKDKAGVGAAGYYRLVGESYVQGVMKGEIIDMLDSQVPRLGCPEEQEIVII